MTDNNAKTIPIPHNIVLEDRQHLTLSGVTDVDTFDEQTICGAHGPRLYVYLLR